MSTKHSGSRQLMRPEFMSVAGMIGFVVFLHVVGWGLMILTASKDLELGSTGVFGLGLGVTAYTLGMRHAFDADHIAAIDNTTRKLLVDGKEHGRPLSVGFYFSLGHSTIVFGLCILLAFGIRSLGSQVGDESSTLQQTTGIIGTAVSGVFPSWPSESSMRLSCWASWVFFVRCVMDSSTRPNSSTSSTIADW